MTCEGCRQIMQAHPGVYSKTAALATLEDLLYDIDPDSHAGKAITAKIADIRGNE